MDEILFLVEAAGLVACTLFVGFMVFYVFFQMVQSRVAHSGYADFDPEMFDWGQVAPDLMRACQNWVLKSKGKTTEELVDLKFAFVRYYGWETVRDFK